MANTTNFGWETPDDTDLVKDGAAAMRTLGNSIDASFVDLKGGTTGQVLSKNSNTDLDFTWVAQDDSNAIQNSIVDAKADLITATANDTPARLAVGNNGETLVADSSTSTGLRYQPPKVINAVYNSAFDIWQRGTSIAILSSGNYAPDRWRMSRTTSNTSTVSRSTDVPTGFVYSAKVQRDSGNTGTGEIYIGQALENSDSSRFIGQTVTLSFYAKSGANYSGGSNFYAQIVTGTGTDQAMYDFTGSAVSSSTITLTTTWTRYTVTATLSGSAKQVGMRFFYTPSGTAGADDSFFVTGVQLELGSVPTTWSRAGGTIAGELAACQRYYVRLGAKDGGTTSAYDTHAIGWAPNTGGVAAFTKFPVTMRVAPTSIEFANLAANDQLNALVTTPDSVIIISGETGKDYGKIAFQKSASFTAFRPYSICNNNNTSAYLAWSAEL